MLNVLKLKNFTCFSDATFSFSKGLNVFIGENASGKSHILKLCYALLRSLRNRKKNTSERIVQSRTSKSFDCGVQAKFSRSSHVSVTGCNTL